MKMILDMELSLDYFLARICHPIESLHQTLDKDLIYLE